MTSKDSIPDVGANGSCVFMASFHLLSSSAPVSSTAGASSAAVSMQLSSARVGGLAPARETVTAAALAACVRSWQGGPLYLVCHWDSLSKGWNFGLVAQNSGDRAHFASRKSTITHNWTQELREPHTSIRGSFWAGSRLTHGFLTAKIYTARHTALIQLSRVIRRIIAACHSDASSSLGPPRNQGPKR